MDIPRLKLFTIITVCLCICPALAFADAGIPMLALIIPGFLVSIIPIIIIESLYIKHRLALTQASAWKTATISNLVSTVAGVPLTWLILFIVEIITMRGGMAYGINTVAGKIIAVTLQAPWLVPYEKDLGWMIPTAGIVLLVPFFFVSWWIEYLISKKMLRGSDAKAVKRAVRNANLITYGLMALCLLIWLAISSLNLRI